VGRDEPIKGLDLAVNIAVTLKVPIMIVGSYSRSMIGCLSSVDNVIFLGSQSRGQLFELMKTSSVLISPTIETFGYSILESLALGTPVITSKYAGVTDWVKDRQLLHVMDNFEISLWCDRVQQILIDQKSFSQNDKTLPDDKK
jgi:glycosyltransferase involved in cell wall biosynthesis